MSSWSQDLTVSSASAWDEVFSDLHGASRIKVPDRHAPWAGRLEWQRSKAYGLALCAGGEEVVSRDTRHIRSDPRGTYELLVPLAGTAWVEQGSSSGEIGPGSMVLCDIDRPLTFAHGDDLVGISFLMAGQNVAGRSPVAAGGPHVLSGARGLGRVIRQLTTTLHEERDRSPSRPSTSRATGCWTWCVWQRRAATIRRPPGNERRSRPRSGATSASTPATGTWTSSASRGRSAGPRAMSSRCCRRPTPLHATSSAANG